MWYDSGRYSLCSTPMTLMVVIPDRRIAGLIILHLGKKIHIEALCTGMGKYEAMEKIGEGVS